MEEKELNEIVVIKQLPVIEQQLKVISDEVDKEIDYALSLECNEESKNEVKNARAKLNKIKTSLEEKRKQVKNAVMNPYNEFENIYNELVKNKLNGADTTLKERIDLIENTQKKEKENTLRQFVEEHCKANNVHIDFEKIGLNITISASEKSLKEQAKTFIEKVADELKLIEQEEFRDEILYEYNQTLNYIDAKTKVLERHKQLEEIKKIQEQKQEVEKQEEKIVEKVDEAIEITSPVEIEQEEVKTYQFEVKATDEQIKKIVAFMKELGVEYK